MKNSLGIYVLAWAVLFVMPFANNQMVLAQSLVDCGPGCGPVYEPGAFRAVEGELGRTLGWPGRVWVSANYADRGLGYRGSYLTLGAKSRLFEDALDGRWLFEGRGHVSEEGGFFGNLGLERVFTVRAAGADVSLAAWFDYDDDQNGFAFADTLESWGVTGQIKTRHWDLIANGYFPIGTSDSTQGDPTGATSFFENSITLIPGIDSGLEGFDVTIRTRPSQLAFLNGSFDFGGYGYESDVVDFFGGGRMRLNLQLLRGAIVTGEVNYDDRFDVTGLLGITLLWGGNCNARGHEYSVVGKDLERTVRNDHIVRFNQDVVLAIDPDTGRPYNVIHVNNLADAAFANGSFETPFTNLADAEAASGPDDIIFVNEGDGTTRNYDTGIALQDGQLFLGEGVRHLIPIDNGPDFGTLFELSNDQDGIRPRITGRNNGAAVSLASRNTVRGFVIDGAVAPGGMANGIFGSAASINEDGIIEDNMITGAILNGVSVTNLAGDWTFARNDIQDNGFSGISLINACDPTSIFTFDSNIASNNTLGNGIEIINYDAASISFTNNVTDGNGMNGVLLRNFKGDENIGVDILFDMHTARNNIGAGISIEDGAGNVTITNSVIGTELNDAFFINTEPFTGNQGAGINITDFTTPGMDRILISGNDINQNGGGASAGINLELTEGFARAMITDNQIDLNGIGIRAFADTVGGGATTLELSVMDNESVGALTPMNFPGTGSQSHGMRYISDGDALLTVMVDQTTGNLPIFGSGDDGISFVAGGTSSLLAVVRNVSIASSGGDGVFGQVVDNGQLSLLVEDSFVGRDITSVFIAPPSDGNANGFNFNFDTNAGGRVNTVIIRNVIAADNVGSGFILNTGTGTLTDVAITNSTFSNPFLMGLRTDGVFDGMNPVGLPFPDRGFATGIVVNATGAGGMMNPQIDNRTRFLFNGNVVDRYTLNGLQLNAFGDAHVLADINNNTISNNGDGFALMMQPDPPFFDGIELNSFGSSVINSRVTANNITGNASFAFSATSSNTSTINALVTGNNMGNSAILTGVDVLGQNNAGSMMNLAFSNNSVDNATFLNLSAMGAFRLELDGFTNGATFAVPFPGNITPTVFGNVVEPLIEAEETAFSVAGFPVSPPSFP